MKLCDAHQRIFQESPTIAQIVKQLSNDVASLNSLLGEIMWTHHKKADLGQIIDHVGAINYHMDNIKRELIGGTNGNSKKYRRHIKSIESRLGE